VRDKKVNFNATDDVFLVFITVQQTMAELYGAAREKFAIITKAVFNSICVISVSTWCGESQVWVLSRPAKFLARR
jgi:hypothetical protein